MANNRLLAALSPTLYEKLRPSLTVVALQRGTVLHRPGEIIQELYFPIDCMISITITMQDGSIAETGLVGNREVVGVNAFMGGQETTQTEYIVQIDGSAMKADASVFREEFNQNEELRNVILRYMQAFIAQLSQTTACNGLHVLEQRLARWLLEVQDRVESDQLMLTQRVIGEMLGVRRAGVTQAAQKLQDKGLISYKRGHVHILNQAGLEAASCECFKVLKAEYNRLLGF